MADSSRQRGAVSARCHTRLAAEDRCQMALVGEPDPLSDLGERLIGPADQGLCPLQSGLHDVRWGPTPTARLKERLK